MPAAKCPRCGKTGTCKHRGDVGAGEMYYDWYTFHCSSCGFTDEKTVWGGSSGGDDWFTQCPFCETIFDPRQSIPNPTDEKSEPPP